MVWLLETAASHSSKCALVLDELRYALLAVGQRETGDRLRPGAQGVTDDPTGPLQLVANQFQARWADVRISDANLNLHKLDELNKVGHRIHTQERQEPAV